MAVLEHILRIQYIGEFLRERGDRGASFEEIQDHLDEKFTQRDMLLSYDKRTFQRDKILIQEALGLEISYSRKRKVHFISREELDLHQEKALESAILLDAYRSSKKNAEVMFFENRTSLALNENLTGILHAIINKRLLSFQHQSLWDSEAKASRKTVQPYALKEFRHRWYLLAKPFKAGGEPSEMRAYGLDRIRDLEFSNSKFTPEKIDFAHLYEYSFGIVAPNGAQPEDIVLAFDRQQGSYVKKLPLHATQKVVTETPTETIITLKLVPTYDFERELLSMGSRVKILTPESLKTRMRKEIEKMLENYSG